MKNRNQIVILAIAIILVIFLVPLIAADNSDAQLSTQRQNNVVSSSAKELLSIQNNNGRESSVGSFSDYGVINNINNSDQATKSSNISVSKSIQKPSGITTITHSVTQNIIAGNTQVMCRDWTGGVHAENSYLRVFDLAAFGIPGPFNVISVDIGIEEAIAGPGSGGVQPTTLNLYTWDSINPFTFANFTLIGTTPVSVADQALSIINVPITATAPANSFLVVEFFIHDAYFAGTGHSLFIGSNTDGQTSPTYVAMVDCGYPEPTDIFTGWGQNIHFVMNVNGSPSSIAISGYVRDVEENGIEGVAVEFSNGGATVFTDINGRYITSVSSGWHGYSTATKDWWEITPESLIYSAVTTNLTDQNYVGTEIAKSYFISGHVRDINNVGIEGVSVEFSNGGATVFTNATGHYSTSVAFGWNGYSEATKDGWTFTPNMFEYPEHVEEDFFGQDISGQDFVGRVALAINDITDSMPRDFTVLPAYPNPFNPSTTITYGLDTDSKVTIDIYDISGKLVSTLQNEYKIQGWYSVIWNGTNNNNEQVPAGIYLGKITSSNDVKTTKLMLLK